LARKIHLNPWRTDVKTREFSQLRQSTQNYEVDFGSVAAERDVTVSSVTWSSQGTRLVSFANEALASSIASADVSSEWGGHGMIRVEATYSDAATERVYIQIRFKDPEHRGQ